MENAGLILNTVSGEVLKSGHMLRCYGELEGLMIGENWKVRLRHTPKEKVPTESRRRFVLIGCRKDMYRSAASGEWSFVRDLRLHMRPAAASDSDSVAEEAKLHFHLAKVR